MAMRNHLGGRDKHVALGAGESGKWDDLTGGRVLPMVQGHGSAILR